MQSLANNKFVKLVLLITAILTISACTTLTKEIPVYKTNTVFIAPPKNLMSPIVPPPPPDQSVYLGMDYQQKENSLTDYATLLLNLIKNSNIQMTGLNNYVQQQQQIESSTNK